MGDIMRPIPFEELLTRIFDEYQQQRSIFGIPEQQFYSPVKGKTVREGANKRGNSSRLTQSFHFFMFEPIFSPVNALNQPI
ncbi:hypothetical protein HEK36_006480 [Escherichia coli]|nr:hypothetical protein [Escherichia coli]